MKKSSFLILFLFLLFHSSIKSQISESVSSNDTLKMFVKHYSNGQKMIEYYENSERQRDSLETKWFSNGNLRSKIYFVQNDVFGKVMEWYSNGQLKFEGERHQNEKTGICAAYFENGQLKYNRLFFRDYPIGKTIEYYANGNKHYQTNLKFIDNDKYIKNRHSRLVIDKLDTLTFKNIGQSISWYENGNKKERNFYSLIGIHNYNKTKKWHENNLIKQKGSFRQKRGVYKEWYSNGQLKLKCKNRKHLLNGKSKFWVEDGAISTIKKYKNGMLKEFNDWDKNGNHIRQFIKTEDLIIEKKWDAEGNLIKHEKMDGNRISIK